MEQLAGSLNKRHAVRRSCRPPTDCAHAVSGSLSLPFRGAFHLSLTVLCAIGHRLVFSLGWWSTRIQTGLHVSRPTWDTASASSFGLRGFHPLWPDFPDGFDGNPTLDCAVPQPRARRPGLGSSPFARHYWGNHCCFLFLRVLRCFSSPGLPP